MKLFHDPLACRVTCPKCGRKIKLAAADTRCLECRRRWPRKGEVQLAFDLEWRER